MFGFLPHNLFTNHLGQSTSGLSPRLWSQVSGNIMSSDGTKRLFLTGDDFSSVDNSNTYTEISGDLNYVGYIDTGGTILGAADQKGGVVNILVDASGANEETGIECGDGVQQLGQISDTTADAHMTAFECRVKISTITDGAASMLAGLAGPGSNDGDVLTDTSGIPTAANHGIGFNIKADDGDAIDFFYEAAGQARVDVIEGVAVPVADTFVKLGFLYDPDEATSKRIKVYVDNVEQSTYVTGTNIAAATFPDAEALTAVFATKGITATAATLGVDWWAFAQVIT
jgi:hypothetical protein